MEGRTFGALMGTLVHLWELLGACWGQVVKVSQQCETFVCESLYSIRMCSYAAYQVKLRATPTTLVLYLLRNPLARGARLVVGCCCTRWERACSNVVSTL